MLPMVTKKRGKRVDRVVMDNFDLRRFKNYVHTYETQIGVKNYSEETILNDFLFGIGICLDKDEFEIGG